MAGKYTPLEKYLRELPESQREVTLRFEEIEGILNRKLPSSADEQSWWDSEKEGNHVNARSWANAGWRVAGVDFKEKWVKLVRGLQMYEVPAAERSGGDTSSSIISKTPKLTDEPIFVFAKGWFPGILICQNHGSL